MSFVLFAFKNTFDTAFLKTFLRYTLPRYKHMKAHKYSKTLLLFAHLTGWALFVLLLFLEDPRRYEFMLREPLPFILNVSILIGYFYLNMNLLVPRLLSKKRIFAYIGVTLFSIAVICFVFPWLIRYLHSFRMQGIPMPNPPGNFGAFSQADFPPPLHPH